MVEIVPVLITGMTFFFIVTVIKILSDNRLRHKLIDKGMVNEKIEFLYSKREELQFESSLKWGLVLIGLGLAFLAGQQVPSDMSDKITIGCMFFFSGGALIVYHFLAKRTRKK